MLVMFWAFELAQSVYGLSAKSHLKNILWRVNSAGKAIAVLFPLLTILLLRAPAIQHIFVAFILLADLPCKCCALAKDNLSRPLTSYSNG